MDAAEQLKAFDQIANKAKRTGLLRFNRHGVMILTLPDQAKPPATRPPPAPSAPVAAGS